MNKLTKNILRIWISITSIIVFAIGWITLAHAQKPAQLTFQTFEAYNLAESSNLAPIPSLEDLSQNVSRPSLSRPSVNLNMPRLRTRGS